MSSLGRDDVLSKRTQIAKDEHLLWVGFCVTVCSLPGQYLFLTGSAGVGSYDIVASLGARVGQVIEAGSNTSTIPC